MDTTLRPLDLHCQGFVCPLKLLALLVVLSPSHMLWDAICDAGACIPSVCLKYLVLCLANALLATGWLLASVLSILGELLTKALGVPPTMPKFSSPPPRHDLPPSKPKRESPVRPHTEQSPVNRRTTAPDSDVPQRVLPAAAQAKDGNQPSSSSPRVTDHGIPDRAHNSGASTERPLPLAPSTPDGAHDLQNSAEPVRGRKLGFIRRHLSSSRGSPKPPTNERFCSQIVASPEQSPERPERTPTTAKACIKKCRSAESVRAKPPVPRTDPYQAPYFFPTPLSPDARDYMSLVRSERVGSPLADARSRANVAAPPAVVRTPTSPPPQSPPEAQPEAALPQPPKFRLKSARRSWHISFRHDHREALERPPSWTSDTTTVVSAGSHPGDASDASHPSSPETGKRSPQRKQSPGRGLITPELKPLHEITSSPTAPSPARLTPRKSWNLPFMHRRSNSEMSTESSFSQVLSRHAADEPSTPTIRPILRRTA